MEHMNTCYLTPHHSSWEAESSTNYYWFYFIIEKGHLSVKFLMYNNKEWKRPGHVSSDAFKYVVQIVTKNEIFIVSDKVDIIHER